jgi:hypothetical protein
MDARTRKDGATGIDVVTAQDYEANLFGHVVLTEHRRVYHGLAKITWSTTGARPNASDTRANPIKTTDAHTPKTSCIGTGGYEIVRKNRVMFVSKSIPSNQ